jgi:hypothetical protein
MRAGMRDARKTVAMPPRLNFRGHRNNPEGLGGPPYLVRHVQPAELYGRLKRTGPTHALAPNDIETAIQVLEVDLHRRARYAEQARDFVHAPAIADERQNFELARSRLRG